MLQVSITHPFSWVDYNVSLHSAFGWFMRFQVGSCKVHMDACAQVFIQLCFCVMRLCQAEESWGVMGSVWLFRQPFHMFTLFHMFSSSASSCVFLCDFAWTAASVSSSIGLSLSPLCAHWSISLLKCLWCRILPRLLTPERSRWR